jgi:hypothetical protein
MFINFCLYGLSFIWGVLIWTEHFLMGCMNLGFQFDVMLYVYQIINVVEVNFV